MTSGKRNDSYDKNVDVLRKYVVHKGADKTEIKKLAFSDLTKIHQTSIKYLRILENHSYFRTQSKKALNASNNAEMRKMTKDYVKTAYKIQMTLNDSSRHCTSNDLFGSHQCIARYLDTYPANKLNDFLAGTDNGSSMSKCIFLFPEISGKNQLHTFEMFSLILNKYRETRVEVPRDMELRQDGSYSVSTTVNKENKETSSFTLRLNVITPEVFLDVMRDFQLFAIELTYSNIYPSDIRMFICLPVYKGGYINNKDTINSP